MSEFAIYSHTRGNEDQRWIGNGGKPGLKNEPIVLDRSLFDLVNLFPNGSIPSGLPLGKVTGTGRFGPYTGGSNKTDELQAISFTGGPTGGSFVPHPFAIAPTAAVNLADTVAQVQAKVDAVAALLGKVKVGGTPGAWTFLAIGSAADTNQPDTTFTSNSLTGGTSPAPAITTVTAGGAETSSDGREVLAGHLFATVEYNRLAASTANLPGALFWDGVVIETYLPSPVDTSGKADVADHITYVTDNVGA